MLSSSPSRARCMRMLAGCLGPAVVGCQAILGIEDFQAARADVDNDGGSNDAATAAAASERADGAAREAGPGLDDGGAPDGGGDGGGSAVDAGDRDSGRPGAAVDGGDAAAADPGDGGPGASEGGVDGGDAGVQPVAPVVPDISPACPTLVTGTVRVLGQDVRLWVGDPEPGEQGPVFFYWHGRGSSGGEVANLASVPLNEVVAEGGMVASFETSTNTGTLVGPGPWRTGDLEMADILLVCAVAQLDVDTRRIYAGGCDGGGLLVGAMAYQRSSYLAAAMPNSGGIAQPYSLEDPAHVPTVITAHGAEGVDVVIEDFSQLSLDLATDIAAQGGFAVDCTHGGGHCQAPADLVQAQWELLKAHPFAVSPEPYAGGLPESFPSYCEIIE